MADKKLNFTKAALEALPKPPAGKRAYYYDTKMRGLGISITSNGTRSFIVYRWVNGKPERVTLGRFPDLSIEQARRKAESINATIAEGGNPNDHRRAERAEITFGALFNEYLERHAKIHKRSWNEDQAMGARKSNVLAMHWDQINLDCREWRIPRTKNETPQIVTLSEEACFLLKQRKETAINNFVFPSTGKTGHLTESKKWWGRILKQAGIADLRIHDLRRTLGSWQARTGASLAIIGKSLNHNHLKQPLFMPD